MNIFLYIKVFRAHYLGDDNLCPEVGGQFLNLFENVEKTSANFTKNNLDVFVNPIGMPIFYDSVLFFSKLIFSIQNSQSYNTHRIRYRV